MGVQKARVVVLSVFLLLPAAAWAQRREWGCRHAASTIPAGVFAITSKVNVSANGSRGGSDLKVQERYHVVNRDVVELTVTLDDAKAYTKPGQCSAPTREMRPSRL